MISAHALGARRLHHLADMLRASLLAVIALTGCTTTNDDVVGPYTGTTHRFVVDRFDLPPNHMRGLEIGNDLDGDGSVDNVLGGILSSLIGQGNATPHADDMIAAGSLASLIELHADDLGNDEAVSVTYYGTAGDPATPVGGRIVDGVFRSNRTATTLVPGTAILRLPIFTDADPTEIEIVGMELDITPDAVGGYTAIVRGGLRRSDAYLATRRGLVQLLEARPQDHRTLWMLVDRDLDGTVTVEELDRPDSLVRSLLTPDIAIPVDGVDTEVISVGFAVHLVPCAAGKCLPATPIDRCFDRVVDGDESGIDCGGSCGDCPAAGMCRTGADCQSGACDGGLCRAPTCSDGIQNGFESDVDCGGICSGCASFGTCGFSSDCASGSCSVETTTCY